MADSTLPVSGQTILAAVVGAVVFELVGPVGIHWAARHVGEARDVPEDHPLTLQEALRQLEERRKTRVVVVAGLLPPTAMLDVPRNLAARLGADLDHIPVRNGQGDVFFVSIPDGIRQMLGSTETLSGRMGCPVFDISEARPTRWGQADSLAGTDLDRLAAELPGRKTGIRRPKVLQRLADFGKYHRSGPGQPRARDGGVAADEDKENSICS